MKVRKILLSVCVFLSMVCSVIFATNQKKNVLKVAADAVPHTELIELVKPDLEKKGINIKLYTVIDTTLVNTQTSDGELDANYFQHIIYMNAQAKDRNLSLANAGSIHVEPMAIYSDKYKSISDLPANAKIAICNDSTNEYRGLKLLEKAGFIELRKSITPPTASTHDIEKYIKPIKVVELDPSLVARVRDQFDAYIVWSSKVMEAGIDVTKERLFSEDGDSPYANIIAVSQKKLDDPAIKTLVEVLKSDKVKKFILEKYKGTVIPAN
jgi:D-methionine transport system substrate-binding protein